MIKKYYILTISLIVIVGILFTVQTLSGNTSQSVYNPLTLWKRVADNYLLPLHTDEGIATGTSRLSWIAVTELDTTNLTVGGTAAGNIDMNNNLLLNIGDAATDFTTGGGLNLAGKLIIATDVFYVATATTQVGIGTTSPAYAFDITASTSAGYLGISDGTGNAGNLFVIDGDGNVGLRTISTGTWQGTAIEESYGGTGTTTTPIEGNILIGDADSQWQQIASATLPFINYSDIAATTTKFEQDSFTYQITNPTTTDGAGSNYFRMKRFRQAATITGIKCLLDEGDSGEFLTIDIYEANASGTATTTLDAPIDCSNTGGEDDGSLTNGAIDAGDWLFIHTISATTTADLKDFSVSVDYNY